MIGLRPLRILPLAFLWAIGAAAAEIPERRLDVPAPGWIEVPLDAAGPAHPAVIGPGGEKVGSVLRARTGQAQKQRRVLLSRNPDCETRGTASFCTLRMPERESYDLALDVPVDETVGFRLYIAYWGPPGAEGRWHPSPALRHPVALDRQAPGTLFRLELHGTARAPRLLGYSVRIAEPAATLLFEARKPGRYRIAEESGAWPASAAVPPEAEPVWIEPVVRERRALTPMPPRARARSPLENEWFEASWIVRAEGALPGDLVGLEIPPEVYAASREALGDLRLAVGDERIPYAIDLEEDPVTLSVSGSFPLRSSAPGWSDVEIPGLRPGLPFDHLVLTAPPRPLHRVVSIPGVGQEQISWTCVPEPPLPCQLNVPLNVIGNRPRKLNVSLWNGDEPPLSNLGVEVWTQRQTLLFVWPEKGPVRLLTGVRELYDPPNELWDLDPHLTERPWKSASLERVETPWVVRALPSASFAFAGLVLAGLIGRELRRRKSAALLLISAALLVAMPADAVSTRVLRVRTVEVPSPGWVRVPIPTESLRHLGLGPDDQRLRVIDPEGEEIPARVEPFKAEISGPDRGKPVSFPMSPRCWRERGVTFCELRLPVPGQLPLRLDLEVSPAESAGFRLYAPKDAQWVLLAKGIWSAPGEARSIPLTSGLLLSDSLRLELYGAGRPVELRRASAILAPVTALFHTRVSGAHQILYGEGSFSKAPAGILLSEEMAVWIEPGAERQRPLPPLPAMAAAPIQEQGLIAAWPIQARGAAPGDVVRLEIPPGVQAGAGNLDFLRLEAGGRQIPYVLSVPHEPAPVPALPRVRFVSETLDNLVRWREIGARVLASDQGITAVQLTVWSPVSSHFTLRPQFFIQGGPGSTGWSCDPGPLLPCRLDTGPWHEAPSERNVSFTAASPATLTLDVALWRRRHVLVFVWPEAGAVRLSAHRGLRAPRYDLAAIADQILIQPWKPAALGPPEEIPRPARWPRTAGVVMAGIALLGFIRKMIPAA